MSEISKIGRALETLTPQVVAISLDKQYSSASLSNLQETLTKLRAFRVSCDNALSKIGEKDPVTLAPRYGPTMVQKIQSLDNNLKTTLDLTEALVQENIAALEEIAVSRLKNEIQTSEIVPVQEVLLETEQPKETIDLERLNAQAEEIRHKKREQLAMERDQRESEVLHLTASVDLLNSLWSTVVPNRSRVINALQTLREELPTASAFAALTAFVMEILEKISRRPDDEKLRRIRINHPFVQVTPSSLLPRPLTVDRTSLGSPGCAACVSSLLSDSSQSLCWLLESPSLLWRGQEGRTRSRCLWSRTRCVTS
jgi:hypothetical protein